MYCQGRRCVGQQPGPPRISTGKTTNAGVGEMNFVGWISSISCLLMVEFWVESSYLFLCRGKKKIGFVENLMFFPKNIIFSQFPKMLLWLNQYILYLFRSGKKETENRMGNQGSKCLRWLKWKTQIRQRISPSKYWCQNQAFCFETHHFTWSCPWGCYDLPKKKYVEIPPTSTPSNTNQQKSNKCPTKTTTFSEQKRIFHLLPWTYHPCGNLNGLAGA